MSIKEKADALIEKYRRYSNHAERNELGEIKYSEKVGITSATHCAINEVEGRIDEHNMSENYYSSWSDSWLNRKNELTALQTELKSRL